MTAFITGPAGCGKTTELVRRAREAAQGARILMTSTSRSSLEVLRPLAADPGITVCGLHEIAFGLLAGTEEIDDVRAAALFEEAAQPLFQLSWVEFLQADLDFEIPGLRAPERFADAAFRLFCKLRDALISPEVFLESALRGAAQFYAKPPNLAGADLLHYTKDTYRDSLWASPAELQRQYRREIDLAKILAKLYQAYLDHPVRAGCLTDRDAVAQASALLRAQPERAAGLRAQYAFAFVDDAQELTIGELAFLQAIFGERLGPVTLAGDRDSTITAFRGARPDRVFAIEGERTVLEDQHRTPFAVDLAARHLSAAPGTPPVSTDPRIGLQLFRATTQQAEAQYISEHVIDLLQGGASPDTVAVVFRSVQCVHIYRDALLQRNVPVQTVGDVNLFGERHALDALALLWCLYDPFRHDYLLRVLQGDVLGLSDASVQALCADPPQTQAPLFNDLTLEPKESRSGRWDSKRDVRLALNVLRGDCDDALSAQARERLTVFRSLRRSWLESLRDMPPAMLARKVWSEGLARDGTPGEAVAQYQQQTLTRLMRRLEAFTQGHAQSSLGEFLEYAQTRMQSPFESSELHEFPAAVRLISLDAARGREFDHVILPNIRAGSFPRWYVPDSFLYSPSMGMIAKENVGDAMAARTAKFTYYMWRTKAREAYNNEERRAFVYALRRARLSALVTSSGRPTRGVAAPEFFAELQAAHLPGVQDFSDRWRPARSSLRG